MPRSLEGGRSFGVEEEVLLLDAASGAPTNRAAEVIARLPAFEDRIDREFFSSQLETATPVCTDAEEALASLGEFRRTVSAVAARLGIVIAGSGLPPVGGDEAGRVTPKPRYREIESEIRQAAAHQYATGTHVHVDVPSRDAGVEVLARLGRWAPALLALTANSPLWCGEDTGFASWRHLKGLLWPVAGYPPDFPDGATYQRSLDEFVASGVLVDPGIVTWVARLSQTFPTVELRIADAQLDAEDAVAFALLVRALVRRALRDARAGGDRPAIAPGMVDGAIWMAARNGLESDLIDPLTAESLPAFTLLDRLLETVSSELEEAGDAARVAGWIARRRADGSPAAVQRAHFAADGLAGLLRRYRAGMHREVDGSAPVADAPGTR